MKGTNYYLHYILRVACAMCFIGHGTFGIITKQVWCNYFAVFNIHEALAYQLMPLIGLMDITLGIIFLFFPIRAIALWMTCWAVFTALLRPLSGEPVAEFFERAGNFGAPLILLLMAGVSSRIRLQKISPITSMNEKQTSRVMLALRIGGFMLLAAHGWLNVSEKNGLLLQYTNLEFSNPKQIAHVIGSLEIIAAFIVLLKPYREIVLVIVGWKILSEMFYPSYGLVEWIERGGSYGILLGLCIMMYGLSRKSVQYESTLAV